MSGHQLNIVLAKKTDSSIHELILALGLEPSSAKILKYRRPSGFEPEPENCHFNVWVQCDQLGGTPQNGWIVGQDKLAGLN